MAEIVNLRRARKARALAEKNRQAGANRVAHGVAKPVRKLAEARAEKEAQQLSGHKLEPDK
jgi:hypothetical protein